MHNRTHADTVVSTMHAQPITCITASHGRPPACSSTPCPLPVRLYRSPSFTTHSWVSHDRAASGMGPVRKSAGSAGTCGGVQWLGRHPAGRFRPGQAVSVALGRMLRGSAWAFCIWRFLAKAWDLLAAMRCRSSAVRLGGGGWESSRRRARACCRCAAMRASSAAVSSRRLGPLGSAGVGAPVPSVAAAEVVTLGASTTITGSGVATVFGGVAPVCACVRGRWCLRSTHS